MWTLRDNYDRRMFTEVYQGNEYGVPADMRGMLVMDLGANIGTFSRLCTERGASVYAVEPSTTNCKVLWQNMEGQPRFVLAQCAAMPREGRVILNDCGNPTSYSVLKASWDNERTGEEVGGRTLPSLAAECLAMFDAERIDLCKMDVEGSEYILIPAYDFAPIDELVIEFHGDFVTYYEDEAEKCRKRLCELGFRELEWREIHPDCGWIRFYRGKR